MLSLDNWRIPGNWLVVNARAKAAPSHVRPFLELAETVCREKKLDFKFYTLSNNGFVGGGRMSRTCVSMRVGANAPAASQTISEG